MWPGHVITCNTQWSPPFRKSINWSSSYGKYSICIPKLVSPLHSMYLSSLPLKLAMHCWTYNTPAILGQPTPWSAPFQLQTVPILAPRTKYPSQNSIGFPQDRVLKNLEVREIHLSQGRLPDRTQDRLYPSTSDRFRPAESARHNESYCTST